jgi:hypothetical protein
MQKAFYAVSKPKEIGTMDEKKMNRSCCGGDHIKGIKCNVQNCYYHDCDTYCTAGEIAVGPRSADSSSETLCTTFKPKAD